MARRTPLLSIAAPVGLGLCSVGLAFVARLGIRLEVHVTEPAHIAAIVLVSGAITWILRALPFGVLAPMRRSVMVHYLILHMPLGIKVILAFYTVRTCPVQAPIIDGRRLRPRR